MKKLIVSRADSNISSMTDITFVSIRNYAKKCGADFLVLDHDTDCYHEQGKWHYRILRIFDLYDHYDRILHIDADILISDSCPDVFDFVDPEKIGSVFEDKGTRMVDRRSHICKVQNLFGDVGWNEGYINTGFFLTSKKHRPIFSKIDGRYYEGFGHDDVHIGYLIKKHGFEVQELDFKWNHMTMFSEEWNGNPNRFDSHVIHYAGRGIFDQEANNRLDQIKRDTKYWNGEVL